MCVSDSAGQYKYCSFDATRNKISGNTEWLEQKISKWQSQQQIHEAFDISRNKYQETKCDQDIERTKRFKLLA